MFSNLKNSLVGKIMLGYAAIILLAFVTTLASMYTTWQNQKMDKLVSDASYPMILSLKETEMLTSESFNLTNNWIYQPSVKEKEKLMSIHATDVKARKENLLAIAAEMGDEDAAQSIREIVTTLDAFVKEQQVVTNKLKNEESYADDIAVDEAITAMDKKITPAFKNLSELIASATLYQNELLASVKQSKARSSEMLTGLYIGSIVLFVVIGIYAGYFSRNAITKPITGLSDLISMLSKGKFVSVTLNKGRDEIGRMAEAIESMLQGLRAKAEFAESIGKGNYNSNFELLSAEDAMGGALIQMRDNLKHAADEDRKRSWASEGLAKFAEILRSRSENLPELSDAIISNLVKYLNANQGALFLVNDDSAQETFIEMVACYAYDRKKYLNKRIEMGEGVTGQSIQERGTIYMSDIPSGFLKITSGLGDALPRHLLVVPLRIEEQIFGAVELASFNAIDPHQIEFVEKLGESIASTIASVKVNGRTRKLLEETQVQAEQMRAQEEEMRQNMEELSATQEEMNRAQRRSEETLREMKVREAELVKTNEELQRKLQEAIALEIITQ
jgi:GAF domain-containing protein/HAMP domain-containing protein